MVQTQQTPGSSSGSFFFLYINLIICLHFYYWSVKSKSVILPIAANVKIWTLQLWPIKPWSFRLYNVNLNIITMLQDKYPACLLLVLFLEKKLFNDSLNVHVFCLLLQLGHRCSIRSHKLVCSHLKDHPTNFNYIGLSNFVGEN